MVKRMLIDATHPEETRMAIIEDNKLLEYEGETQSRRALKGNVYLAKVIRVEPSLQAAFVEYGGNRHGFLPFSEIHPDYFRIPVSDREKLIEEERARAKAEAEADAESGIDEEVDLPDGGPGEEGAEKPLDVGDEKQEMKPRVLHRLYKIQEVVNKGQVMLVQVVKEERGGKGASLTTYLSLPGRYSVLMPNAIRTAGISRKITNVKDRKRLKSIVEEFDLPESMGAIIRTAGLSRTKREIKRDITYLINLWSEIREKTLQSVAPALIYEEGDLVQRSIRDTFNSDIEEILVEGKDAYRHAKDIMKKMAPSSAKRVKQAEDNDTLFQKYDIHAQVDAMFDPVVPLRSGGYLVMNITEALVAIDVNSGRSTKDRHIDETAFRTNMEAAEEVARQLRLRDMAGIVVIDFIDMREPRNIAAVERKFRESVKQDRARIQVGHISMFGLLELSRQRLRPSIVEMASHKCATCEGTGMVRSAESTALQALRSLEARGKSLLQQDEAAALVLFLPRDVAYYLMNQKRKALVFIEDALGAPVEVREDPDLRSYHYRLMTDVEYQKLEGKTKESLEKKMADLEKDMNIKRPSEGPKREELPRGQKSRRRRGRNRDESTRSAHGESKGAESQQAAGSGENEREDRRRRRNKEGSVRKEPFTVRGEEEENTSTTLVPSGQVEQEGGEKEPAREGQDTETRSRNRRRRSRTNRRRSRDASIDTSASTGDDSTTGEDHKSPAKNPDRPKRRDQSQEQHETQGAGAGVDKEENKAEGQKKVAAMKKKEPEDEAPTDQEAERSPRGRRKRGWLKRLLEA